MKKEYSRLEFLKGAGQLTAAGILVPKVGIGENPQIETPRNLEFLLPTRMTIKRIGLDQQITPTGLDENKNWIVPENGISTPIENPHTNFGEFWDLRNTTYVFGHSDFLGQRQVAADFEKLNPGDVITIDDAIDKMSGKKIPNLNYIVNPDDGLIIADLDQIRGILYHPHVAHKPRYPRLVLQTTYRTDRTGATPLLDSTLLERAKYDEETIQDPSKYLCLVVIANLAK